MQAGDGIIYYSPKLEFEGHEKCQAFTAIGTLRGDRLYQSDLGNGFVPFRRDVTYQPCVEVPIAPLLPHLTFIHDQQKWGSVFRFGLLEIPRSDFERIASQMLAAPGNLAP